MSVDISVIVPVYNGAETIERCISSVTEGELKNIEVIVVDDGSEDNTAELVSSVCDERVHIIRQGNTGQGLARNTGLAAASGEYIAFVDADDTVDKKMFSAMLERARLTGADMVQCNIRDIYPDGRNTVQLKPTDETIYIDDTGLYADKYFSTCRHSYEVCNKIIKRELLEKHGLRFCDTRKYFSEDLMFNLHLLRYLETVSFIPEPYYNYYQNENSHFNSNYQERLSSVYKLFYDYIKNADLKTAEYVSYTASMVTLYNIGFCAESETAKTILKDKFFLRCIRNALKRHCTVKHRLFLTAVYISPVRLKSAAAKFYSTRW